MSQQRIVGTRLGFSPLPLTPNCNRTKANLPELASMAPGATITYSCQQANVRKGFDNVATATGTPPSAAAASMQARRCAW